MIRTKWISPVLVAVLLIATAVESVAIEDRVPGLFQESYALEAAGDFAGAVAALRRVPVGLRESYVYQLRLGWLLYLAGEYEASSVAYRRALALAPKAVEPRLGLLLPLMAQRLWGEAEQTALDALKLDADNYLAASRLAFVLFNQGRYAEAGKRYQRVLALYPSDAEMRAGLGWSMARAGDLTAARAEFEEILAVAPRHPSAREGLQFVRSSPVR